MARRRDERPGTDTLPAYEREPGLRRVRGLDDRHATRTNEFRREGVDLPLAATRIERRVATRDEENCRHVLARMAEWAYEIERVR